MVGALKGYFPRAEGTKTLLDIVLPERPLSVERLDQERACQPLAEFHRATHDLNFAPRPPGENADLPPPMPGTFTDPYLMPALTAHERLRLTLLWYHTRDLTQDSAFMAGLQEKVNLAHLFMGWEFAGVGLLSEDIYSRLVTVGIPVANTPRRETPCAHTINQQPGTVFMLPDMQNDWRFQQAPHVHLSGMRAYAAAQLRCRSQTGQEVSFGSLCIASMSARQALDMSQQAALVRFADMIASEIVTRSHLSRRHQRDLMGEQLARSYAIAPEKVERYVLGIIVQTYPQASVTLQNAPQGMVDLPNHDPLPVALVEDGLWEDANLIEDIIKMHNHQALTTDKTVRAIVHGYRGNATKKYIVVASSVVQHVYDDIDSWFIERCAQRLRESVQERRLDEAIGAKEKFLRGITHQLRTPIHGVLGSCDLLAEELASRNQLAGTAGTASLSPSTVLNTIRDSGRELMTTVNNMLKLTRWAETGGSASPARLSAFNQIETDIIYEVNQTVPEHELADISILFENQLASNEIMVVIDLHLLKECIQALVLNALLYTEKGAVIITISAPPDYSYLRFDVRDTGCGIALADQGRVFEAYEKVASFTRGAGLGLTLASKIVEVMNGSVTLEESSQDGKTHGSHFRADFYSPGFACPRERIPPMEASLHDIPRSFHVIPAANERPDLVLHFARYLEHRGFEDSNTPEGSMIIITYTPDPQEFRSLVDTVDARQVAMCLIPAGATESEVNGLHTVRFFSGPFLTSRLEEIIRELDTIYKRLNGEESLGETSTGHISASDPHRTSETSEGINPTSVDPIALLVDDNVVNLRIMRMYCEKRQIPYREAIDGHEAVKQFQTSIEENRLVNIVLLDLQMPKCDGIEAAKEIRRLESDRALPPSCIFMVTGQDSVTDRSRSFDAGANEFYVKPMSIKTLDRGIAEYFPALKHRVKAKGKSGS